MKTETKKTALYCIAGVVALCVAANTVMTGMAMNKSSHLENKIQHLETTIRDNPNFGIDVAQENNVSIAGSYKIRSTKEISDAYLSGDKSGLNAKQKETLKMASDILDKIITKDMSKYEKELAVYRWMTSNLSNDDGALTVIPTTQEDCDNPYGVLKYHNAVCVGYATTFRLFMQMMKIPCKVVHNTSRTHSWDLVKLDDEWYHTDIYMDADTGNYADFNMNDATCLMSHDWNRDFFPAATGAKYSYANQNKKTLADAYALPAALKAGLDAKATNLFFDYKDTHAEEQVMLSENIMSNVTNWISTSDAFSKYNVQHSWIKGENGQYVLLISIEDTSKKKETKEISNLQAQKVRESILKAFGEGSGWTYSKNPDGEDYSAYTGDKG
jgi:hypothetical protein